jgi:hypothetical protein
MSHAKARNLFNKALQDYATTKGYKVAYDNVKYSPVVGEVYLQSHLIPASTLTETLGGDHKMFLGLYQVSIVTAYGTAVLVSDTIAAELQNIFTIDKVFTDTTGFQVQVYSPFHTPEGKVVGTSWIVPSYFEYRSDTN